MSVGQSSHASSVPFPPVDIASLGSASRWLLAQEDALHHDKASLQRAAQRVSRWSGPAGRVWHDDLALNRKAIDDAARGLGGAARALAELHTRLVNAQARYEQATIDEVEARQQLLAFSEPSPAVPSFLWPQQMTELNAMLDRAIEAQRHAVDIANRAAHETAGKLFDLASRLPHLSGQGTPGAPPSPTSSFLATVRISGLPFITGLYGGIVGDPGAFKKPSKGYIRRLGIDAHAEKTDVIGSDGIAHYDIYKEKETGDFYVGPKTLRPNDELQPLNIRDVGGTAVYGLPPGVQIEPVAGTSTSMTPGGAVGTPLQPPTAPENDPETLPLDPLGP
jgi:hypothetical protein